jgi:acetyltransferase
MVRWLRAHELIVGVADDSIFGPTVLSGAGGTAVKVIRDTAVALPPLDLTLARDLIDGTRMAKLLAGYRDHAPADLGTIAMRLVRICQLIIDLPVITEIDVNPLLADDKGGIALGARIKADWSHAGLARQIPGSPFALSQVLGEGGHCQWQACLLPRPIQPTNEAH